MNVRSSNGGAERLHKLVGVLLWSFRSYSVAFVQSYMTVARLLTQRGWSVRGGALSVLPSEGESKGR